MEKTVKLSEIEQVGFQTIIRRQRDLQKEQAELQRMLDGSICDYEQKGLGKFKRLELDKGVIVLEIEEDDRNDKEG